MKKLFIILLLAPLLFSCSKNLPAPYNPDYTIEGKWMYEGNSLNTMYIFENGIRYTYYCVGSNCDSLYNTYEAGDSNAIPGTNLYTFENDTLTIDLNFGNFFKQSVAFECNGNVVVFGDSNLADWHRLNTDLDNCN
jgi:hypothetical protein